MTIASKHAVHFYDEESFLLGSMPAAIKGALTRGEGAVVIATAPHIEALTQALREDGLSIDQLIEEDRLDFRDAEKTLASLLVDGIPDGVRFDARIGRLVRRKLRKFGRLTAFGEMVNLLWQDGNRDAAIALEHLWNDLLKSSPFELTCAYRLNVLDSGVDLHHLDGVCDAHNQLFPAEDPVKIEQAFFQAVRQAVPASQIEMLEAWIARNGVPHATSIREGVSWLRRFLPEYAPVVLRLARSFVAAS